MKGKATDSCGKSGTDETPQPPAESEALYGNQRRCHKRFSSCISFLRL
ncbi:hypothetical protein H7K20_23490 [Priestia aryabhattai]|nr:hypothetical protein [Priestia aryabhattai]